MSIKRPNIEKRLKRFQDFRKFPTSIKSEFCFKSFQRRRLTLIAKNKVLPKKISSTSTYPSTKDEGIEEYIESKNETHCPRSRSFPFLSSKKIVEKGEKGFKESKLSTYI